jgi:hypothetical protein
MRNFTTYCGVPALCDACRRVVVANFLETSAHCRYCGGPIRFYTDADLQAPAPADAEVVFSWRINKEPGLVLLPDAAYLCPECQELHMRLEEVGDWD